MIAVFWPVYLLDTSSPVSLDGLDKIPPTPPLFTPDQQEKIWLGLEAFAKDKRLKLITQVRDELRRHDPPALARLQGISGTRMPPVTNDLRLMYQNLLAKYPKLRRNDPKYDDADPWLVVSSQKYKYMIITEETSASTKSFKPRRIPIPDLCAGEGLATPVGLRVLAITEGWIK